MPCKACCHPVYRSKCTTFGIPTELAEIFLSYVEPHTHKLDHLVDRFTLHYAPEDLESVAAIAVQREYRKADIFFTPKFLELSEFERTEAVLHELAHILTDPLYKITLEIIEWYVPPQTQPYVSEQLRKAHEQTTEELSRLLSWELEEGAVLPLGGSERPSDGSKGPRQGQCTPKTPKPVREP